ncbi:MAG: hypothetical protein KBT27_16355 [Prevotellaceae bacterium]|nr:hypothetical protein [Candidatus Faecinaster equi]
MQINDTKNPHQIGEDNLILILSKIFIFSNQFEIVDAREVALTEKTKNKSTYLIKDADSAINGKATYARICIRKCA